jgi:hypothetical protein
MKLAAELEHPTEQEREELRRADEALASDDDIPENYDGSPDPTDAPGATGSAVTGAPAPGASGAASPARTGASRPATPDDSGLDDDPGTTPGRAAAQAKAQILAERFSALGWTPRKFRADVLRACSLYLRRRVGGVREMTASEMSTLADELSRLQRKHMDEPDVYPVALADKVEEWHETWEQADIAGYERYREEIES